MLPIFGPAETERRASTVLPEHVALLAYHADDGYTDKVTHCHNRLYLVEVLGPQIEASRCFDFPLSLVLAEIKHFRQIRYIFGHNLSDQFLEETAALIRSKVRSTDLLVRYGNETFGLLLLHANRHGAEIVCRRLKALISRHSFKGRTGETILKINFGGAELMPEHDASGKDLLAEAVRALDQANTTGEGAIEITGSKRVITTG